MAGNTDTKECGAFGARMSVHVDDVRVTAGEDPHFYTYTETDAYFPPPPYAGSPLEKATYYIDMQQDTCIAGQCISSPAWNMPLFMSHDIHDHGGGYMGIPNMAPLPRGTYNSTVRLHSRMLKCDVTAVGTVFVE